ncbi:MAG: hypothetical protein M1819_005953 [Sarea resinae]|nr:MAG: hypothetical protein M1819_005953 [Sarea resinae]
MAEESPQSVRTLFDAGERQRKQIESSWDTNSQTYQDKVREAVATYEDCRKLAAGLSLFSPNETLEDISSDALRYLLIDFYLAELVQKENTPNRKATLSRAREAYDRYLSALEMYEILSREEQRLYERFQESPGSFSTASTTDAAARRETKIARFKEEKELKSKLEYLGQNPMTLANDDASLRELHLANMKLCTHQAFQSLESISQELQILALAPPNPVVREGSTIEDSRQRNERAPGGYSDRLDGPMSQLLANGKAGPILDKDGKPLRPFTLLDSRQRLQQGVFRPDHSLPTMTIDEYLEEEKRRGGIIEGGGEKSGMQPKPNEDDFDKADEETMKAREWDEYTEANPKGSGNTINRG